MKKTKKIKVRVKDKHAKHLGDMARAVNFVWNYINALSTRSIKEYGKFLSVYDIHPYTKGAGKELGLHSQTLQCVASEYVTRRKLFSRAKLGWRKSGGARRSLGWIPINTGAASWRQGQVLFNGHSFKVWDSFGLSQYAFRTASFAVHAKIRNRRQDTLHKYSRKLVNENAARNILAAGHRRLAVGIPVV